MKVPQRSLASDLIKRLVIGLTLLCVALGTAIYLFVHHSFVKQFDEGLIAKARGLASLVQESKPGDLEFEFADELMPEFERVKDHNYFQVWRPDGSVLEKSNSLGDAVLPRFYGTVEKPRIREFTLKEHTRVRAVGMRFTPELSDAAERALHAGERVPADPVTLVVARGTRDLRRTLATLVLSGLAGAALLLAGAWMLVTYTVRRELRPVGFLSAQVEEIGTESMNKRVEVPRIPGELLPVQLGINGLLERLSEAFARERRFTSDVSHELKTPLAEAMAALSVAQNWPEDQALQARSGADAMGALRRMQRLVEILLRLSRSEASSQAVELSDVDVLDVLRRSIGSVSETAASRNVSIHLTSGTTGEVQVKSNALLLESVVGNLLRNAVEYAPQDSEIGVQVRIANDKAEIDCSNQAPGLEKTEVMHLLEPFWRKEASRTDSAEHSGLGLTLAASFSKLLGGQLSAELRPDGVLTMQLQLPIAQLPHAHEF